VNKAEEAAAKQRQAERTSMGAEAFQKQYGRTATRQTRSA
jgi:hypothetical protein